MIKKAILLVDDEMIVLKSLKNQLKKNFGPDYVYEIAENVDEAFEVIDEFIVDGVKILIIMSDWLMPGIKGDEFLIKVHEKYPEIITILLTGQANEESIKRAKEKANLHKCLFKPWKEKDLIDTIKSGLEKL